MINLKNKPDLDLSVLQPKDSSVKISPGKAPEPTGASTSMFKAWPDANLDQVLDWINEIWRSGGVYRAVGT